MTEAKPKVFLCWLAGATWGESLQYAFSAGKARSNYWRDVRESWPDVPYTAIRSRAGQPTQTKAFRRTAEYRGLPFAAIGMRVECEGHPGVIADANDSANFDVFFTGGPHKGLTGNCHPHSKMKYFDAKGAVIFDSEVKRGHAA